MQGNGTATPMRRQCTLAHNVIVDGDTYFGGSKLVSVDPPKITQVVDRQVYTLKFTDPDFEFRPYFEAGWIGYTVNVRMGFINTTETIISGVSPGSPFLSITDTILAYSGAVDRASYDINLDGAVMVTVECASPLGQLSLVRSFLTNRESIRQRPSSATDTSFDQVFVGSKGVQLLWGKEI
jgi:hypothetical protein